MDTAVPLAYNFRNHEMKMNSHRMMAPLPGPGQNMTYYGSPAVTYSTALQPPSYALHPLLSQQPQYHQGFFSPVTTQMQRVPPQHTQPQVSLPQEHSQLQAHHHQPHPPHPPHHQHHPQQPQQSPQQQQQQQRQQQQQQQQNHHHLHPHPHPHPHHHHHPSHHQQHVPDARFDKTAVPNLIRTPPPEPMPQRALCSATVSRPQEQTMAAAAPVLRPEVTFSTEVDTLMKAIQAKPILSEAEDNQLSSPQQSNMGSENQSWPQSVYASPPGDVDRAAIAAPQPASKSRRKYQCTLPGCGKAFYQKTHLDIHMRAHTGDKPFLCKEPGCGQRFSQLGNLRTHQRRHTGEKPFSCDICHKRFAQRGNVRAHKITHQRAKPYICRLDDCKKPFTQLGNLKSHQNKFHAQTLRDLTMRFANITDTQHMSPQEKELWTYFAGLYKNSNKGIKGRGKDRRVSTARKCCTNTSSNMSVTSAEDEHQQMQSGMYMNTTQPQR